MGDERQGGPELLATVAAERAQDVTCQTLRMQTDQRERLACQRSAGERRHFPWRAVYFEDGDLEVAKACRQRRAREQRDRLCGLCHWSSGR